MPAARISIWSEMVPYGRVGAPALLRALGDRGVRLTVAVTRETAAEAARLVAACRDAGVEIGLWPMLDDRQGRWASSTNGRVFRQFTEELLATLRMSRTLPDEVAIDLEPPIGRVRAMLRGSPRAVLQLPDEGADLGELVRVLHGEGLRVSAAVTLLTALPSAAASRGWQALLGTPIDCLELDVVNAMAYTSLLEGYTRRRLRRRDALGLLGAVAATAVERWGARAAISVGVVGVGALGDEQIYRTPTELAEDVAAVRSAGVRDVALFGLDGVLARPPIGRWLDALCDTTPGRRPGLTGRGRALLTTASAVGLVALAGRALTRRAGAPASPAVGEPLRTPRSVWRPR